MVHHGQCLPLRLEAGDDLPGVHAWLDHFESDLPLHRLSLFGHVDRAHPSFANLLQELVGADLSSGALADRSIDGRKDSFAIQERVVLAMSVQ